jgi:hypothetical protein
VENKYIYLKKSVHQVGYLTEKKSTYWVTTQGKNSLLLVQNNNFEEPKEKFRRSSNSGPNDRITKAGVHRNEDDRNMRDAQSQEWRKSRYHHQ